MGPYTPTAPLCLACYRHLDMTWSVISLSEDKGCPQEGNITRQLRLIIITTIPIIPVIIGN